CSSTDPSSLARPALYGYLPLARPFVESLSHKPARRDDARLAIEELKREPAAAIFARAHASARASDDDGLFASVMLPLLVRTAELCGGVGWGDAADDKGYPGLEAAVFGRGHSYGARAPPIGVALGGRAVLPRRRLGAGAGR